MLRINGTFDLALWVHTATCCKRQNVDKFHDNDMQLLLSKLQLLLGFLPRIEKQLYFYSLYFNYKFITTHPFANRLKEAHIISGHLLHHHKMF